MPKPVVIGIAGGSGSGKSTVLSSIIRALGLRHIAVLDHDAYYHDLSLLPEEDRLSANFDHPDALDTSLMVAHLDMLLAGNAVEKPVYDFNSHVRLTETVTVEPKPVIIVEGILVLTQPELVRRMDIKLYVEADPDVRLIRRIRRDIEQRSRSIESILDQYERTVRPMHLEFVEPSRQLADVIIPRGGRNQVAIDMILARLRSLLEKPKDEIAV